MQVPAPSPILFNRTKSDISKNSVCKSVITAQSNILQSELELASIKRPDPSAVSELCRALGGGWR
jgi:hypothetical protein